MGKTIRLYCQNCAYDRTFYLGRGLLYKAKKPNPYLITSEISSKALQDEILQRYEDSQRVVVSKDLYACDKCGGLYNRLTVEMTGSKKTYRAHYQCPRCNRRLKKKAWPDGPVTCPQCKRTALSYQEKEPWD